jgi:hypothetical protein
MLQLTFQMYPVESQSKGQFLEAGVSDSDGAMKMIQSFLTSHKAIGSGD